MSEHTMHDTVDADAELFHRGPPLRLQTWLGLVKAGQPRIGRRALLVIAIGWIPLALLSAVAGNFLSDRGGGGFLLDIGAHARFLVAAPLLILAESLCAARLGIIARQFSDAGLIADTQRAHYAAAVGSTRRLLESPWIEAMVVLLAYALVAAIAYNISAVAIPAWHGEVQNGTLALSAAGFWGLLVSLPLLLVLLLGWLWRIALWVRFLRLMSRLDLQLVAAHPDRAGGLGFVGTSLLALAPLGFIAGVIVAGPIAGLVLNQGASPLEFAPTIVGLAVCVVIVFSGPLLVFARRLTEARRRGMYQYGGLASGVGQQFERKWLAQQPRRHDDSLGVPDFSAMADLNQVVANVYALRAMPVDLVSVVLLIVMTLLPFLPVALTVVPLTVILSKAVGFLF